MENEVKLVSGAMVALAVATAALVVMPYLQVRDIQAPAALKPYTTAQLRGREVYVANGCVYCHTQQPRDRKLAPDFARGWGRPSVPADYVYDRPHLLGSMRTGPDLFNIGARQPSKDWHLGHLYQPRAYVPYSTMPSFPYLFLVKDALEEGDAAVLLPPAYVPAGKVVVASQEAQDLVKYLQSLNHTYPVLPAPVVPAAVPVSSTPLAPSGQAVTAQRNTP